MQDDFALDIVQLQVATEGYIYTIAEPWKHFIYSIFPIIIFGEQFQERVLIYDLNK